MKQTHIFTLNLKRVIEDKVEIPSTVTALANAYEGTLKFNMKLNALADNVTFDLNAQINILDAIWDVVLNAFIQALLPSIDNEININLVNTATPLD